MGKPKHSNDTRGEQKGAQAHAEGQHGAVAREHLKQQQINNEGAEVETRSMREANDPNRHGKHSEEAHALHERMIETVGEAHDGGHRLFENRKQHDEADHNQDKNRLGIDVNRHSHNREQFQLEGGRETHPALVPPHPALAPLRRADPLLARVIRRVGPCRFEPRREGTHFDAVLRAIVYQQL